MNKNVIKKTVLIVLSCLTIFLFVSPFFAKNVYILLSKTSLYNTHGLKHIESEHSEEEKELVYFENEFINQPYNNPIESSVELIQFSLSFLVLSFLIKTVRRNT